MITNVDAVTIFNSRLDKETRRKVYIPTVIKGVSMVESKGSEVANNGVWSAEVQYKIRIPQEAEIQDGRAYIPAMKYAKLENGKITGFWTISKGDLVIQEEYLGENSMLYEEEVTRYAQEQGADLIHVTEYADDTSGGSRYMRHWRIGGR